MLLHVRPNLESCHVIDRHAKVVLAVYVLPAELNHVLAVAGNQTLCGRGYGKLQLALPAPTVVDVHVSEYGAVTLNCDEAKVAGFFVLYLDAELILVRADELHFARPLVCQRGYGMLFGDFPDGDAVCEAP